MRLESPPHRSSSGSETRAVLRSPAPATSRRRVLYIHMAALGDAIMASAALRELKRSLPGAHLTVLARTHARDYFRGLPYVDDVLTFVDERFVDRTRPWRLLGAPADCLRLWRALRQREFDAVVQWRGQLPDTLMSAVTRARHRVAAVQSIHRRSMLPVEKLPFLVTDLVSISDPVTHLVEAMAAPALFLVAKLTGEPVARPDLSLDYPLTAADCENARSFLAENKISARGFAMVNLSAKSAFNHWPEEKFAAVADHLQSVHRLPVVLSGLPEHRAREAAIADKMRDNPPVRTAGALPFGVVAALLSYSRILISLNTGISHVAAALQVPVVVLNGRDGASITPWRVPHRIVTRNPHYPRRHPDAKAWPNLVPLITPDEVTAAADALLFETDDPR